MHTFLYRLSNRSYPPDILSMVEELAEYKGRQGDFLRAKPEALEVLYETVSAQSTAASGGIEGIRLPPERLRALMELNGIPRDRPEEETAGYRDVLRAINDMSSGALNFFAADGLITPETILRMHGALYKYTTSPHAGHWKSKNNVIEAQNAKGEVIGVVFHPPAAAVTPRFVEGLCKALGRAREKKEAPALVLVAAFVFDFLCIHPFENGNGRVARLLAHLLLTREGYMVGRYVPLERLILESKEAYYAALRQSSDGWHDKIHDPDPWIRYFLNVLLRAYKEMEVRVSAISDARDHLGALIRDAVLSRRDFTMPDLRAAVPKVSRAYLYRIVGEMISEGRLRRLRRGRYAGA